MSSLVVTGGATYERVDPDKVESLVIDFDKHPDPELNPDIAKIIKPSSDRGYLPEDRNDLLRAVQIESKKKPLKSRGDDGLVISKSPPIDIPGSIPRGKSSYKVPARLTVDLEAEKRKSELMGDDEEGLVVTKGSGKSGGATPLSHEDAPDADIGDVDGGFDSGDLLFNIEINDGAEDDFEGGGDVGDYFSW